jgi:EAL domain-containing protein (putative c-di-GMP-specific phosphodiesterase class I)
VNFLTILLICMGLLIIGFGMALTIRYRTKPKQAGQKDVKLRKNAEDFMTHMQQQEAAVETKQTLIEQQLQQALANGELYLNYQPQYNNQLGKIEAFEALLRWKNPILGVVAPDSFVKTAEITGLIVPIGEWVLETACRFIKKIHREGFTDCRIAVNVSIVQFLQENFAERIFAILQEVGLGSGYLELELTESLPLGSLEVINDKLKLLKAWGVRIALDDFGTGYASLSCLNRLNVDTLKIDKSFIDGILERQESVVLTQSIIGIGRQLGLKVIAEGVENQAQVNRLTEWNCYLIQGYFYSRPVAEKEAVVMIKGMRQKAEGRRQKWFER